MSDISIDKKTGISISLLLVIAPIAFWGITAWTRVQAQTDRNTNDITAVLAKLDTLNDNLNKTNGNIIELSTKLESLSARRNLSTSTVTGSTTSPVSVTYLQPSSSVQPTTIQPAPQKVQQPLTDYSTEQQQPPNNRVVVTDILYAVKGAFRLLE